MTEPVPFRRWVVARADDDRTAPCFEDRVWSYREWVVECARRAAFLLAKQRGSESELRWAGELPRERAPSRN